jgi:TDG/mug DNA glycosylase family protein
MSTEQINIRLKSDLAAALDRVAREESLDRATVIRRLLDDSLRRWELDRAVRGYQTGELSLGRAAEEAGLTQWDLLEAVKRAGVAHPLTAEEAERRLAGGSPQREPTLPDIPPSPGGVLLVGINPAPISVAAGHYYQGRIGQRLWRRLERLGLLHDAVPGAEDEAFARAGHGLTDLVKRPTAAAAELDEAELEAGVEALRSKVREWKPGLVLFAFADPARRAVDASMTPGAGSPFEGTTTFLLSGPYAAKAEADRIDGELKDALGRASGEQPVGADERTQPVTATDMSRGQIRLPRGAKRLFPAGKATVEIVLRGTRVKAAYDPRVGPDRERSAVLRIGVQAITSLVGENEVLRVSRGHGGVVLLD